MHDADWDSEEGVASICIVWYEETCAYFVFRAMKYQVSDSWWHAAALRPFEVLR